MYFVLGLNLGKKEKDQEKKNELPAYLYDILRLMMFDLYSRTNLPSRYVWDENGHHSPKVFLKVQAVDLLIADSCVLRCCQVI